MTFRGAPAGCMPSRTASFHDSEYQAQSRPFVDSVSPMVFSVCGGRGFRFGSAKRESPPAAGGILLGSYGGCMVLTANPSGVIAPSLMYCGGPLSALAGELGLRASLPSASRTATSFGGALGKTGLQAQTSQK